MQKKNKVVTEALALIFEANKSGNKNASKSVKALNLKGDSPK